MVVGEVRQRRPVLAQRVVAGVGVVVVVTVRNIWDGVLGVDGAAGGEGDGRRVALLVLLLAAVKQQQSEQQHHQDDEHNDAADGPPRLPLTGREGDHDAARLLRRVLFALVSSALTHTVSGKSVADEAGRTGAGLSAERAKTSWTAGYGAVSRGPAGQTLAVTVPVVACGVVGTVDTHFRTQFAVVTSWTNLITVGSGVTGQAVTLSCHMVAAVRLTAGRTRHAALVAVHPRSAFVLTGDPPVTWTTHTRPSFPQAGVAVGAVLEAGLVAVAPPQAF